MSKTAIEAFRDWEGDTFGFGYGTGEDHIVPALKVFLATIPANGAYDYRSLENALGATVAWLLINALCRADIIEYGTSPRHGWLTPQGKQLRDFVASKSVDELVDMTCADQSYVHCYSDCCNCEDGSPLRGCQHNPFWIAP
jgi:hypothetical protein